MILLPAESNKSCLWQS